MKDHRTKTSLREGRSPRFSRRPQGSLPGRLPEGATWEGAAQPGLEFLINPAMGLLQLGAHKALETLAEMMEADRTALCGPKDAHLLDRKAYRYGRDGGVVVLGGRRVRVLKPRVRSVQGKELLLPTYQHFATHNDIDRYTLQQMVLGVSTRGYPRGLEPVGEDVEPVAVDKSSVSRRFVALTEKKLEEFLNRSLEGLDLVVLMLDGLEFSDHTLVTALGIDSEGRKHVLGLWEGTTENETLCRELLRNLISRGLKVERARLYVIDGGKALRKAIRKLFGAWALIARCQLHKVRNVTEQLPQRVRGWVAAAMHKAYRSESVPAARRRLQELLGNLEDQYPGAAASLREGMEETLMILGLGVGDTLRRSLSSTNLIENLQGTLRRVSRNVKRWRGGRMVLRWAATGMLEAQRGFRRVKGYRDLPKLTQALEALCPLETSSENVA